MNCEMNNKTHKVTQIAFATIGVILVIPLIIIVYYFFIKFALNGLSKLSSIPKFDIYIPVIAVIISVTLTKYFERMKSIQEQHRQKKITVYESLIDSLGNALTKSDNDSKLSKEKLDTISRNLVLWGSHDLIHKYMEFTESHYAYFKEHESDDDQDWLDSMFSMLDDILLLIRKDIGFKDDNLKKGDLIKLMLLPTFKLIAKKKESDIENKYD